MPLSTGERAAQAALASNARWAKETDRSAAIRPAHEGLRAKFLREADPDGTLPPEVREQRAESLRKAHYARLQLASAKAKRLRREAAELDAQAAELDAQAAELDAQAEAGRAAAAADGLTED